MVLPQTLHTHIARGNAAMKKNRFKRQGNIVHTIQEGNTTIHICDDSFAKTPEDVDRILEDMHAAGWAIIESLNQKGGDKK